MFKFDKIMESSKTAESHENHQPGSVVPCFRDRPASKAQMLLACRKIHVETALITVCGQPWEPEENHALLFAKVT